MREELERLVASGKLTRQQVEPVEQLATDGFCLHRSWGCGKITTVDTVAGTLTVDFPSKPNHTMDLSFAADLLKPISPDHILARKVSDLSSLREMAAVNHAELIKLVLQSHGGKATVEQIQQVLTPDVITDDWKKWWDVAKKELKKSGHFQIPVKKSQPIIYQEEAVPLQERLMRNFRDAKGLKARLAVVGEFLKSLEELEDPKTAGQEVIDQLNAEIYSHQRTQTALALEAILARDEVRRRCSVPAVGEEQVTTQTLWRDYAGLEDVLPKLPVSKQKEALEAFKQFRPDDWHEALLESLNKMPARVCGEFVKSLEQAGYLDQVKEQLNRLVSQHQASSDLLLWLAKNRSDTFADVLGPEVFRAMLSAIERDQFSERKPNRLPDLIMEDENLVVELAESAEIDVIKDLTRALQFSSCFDDMDKRSLLARIVKHFPAAQSLVSGDNNRQDDQLVVSWESLEQRQKEYKDLVERRIPENSKEIAIARSHGDLRENHEYKAAKENQKILMRTKSEMETQLVRARGTDFQNPRTDVVSIGCQVQVTDTKTGKQQTYTILGAWDSDVDKNIISYQTPFAQSLLNHQVGDKVEFETEGKKRSYRIDRIEPAKVSAPTAHAEKAG